MLHRISEEYQPFLGNDFTRLRGKYKADVINSIPRQSHCCDDAQTIFSPLMR